MRADLQDLTFEAKSIAECRLAWLLRATVRMSPLSLAVGSSSLRWISLLPKAKVKIFLIARTIDTQPFNQRANSCALHAKPSGGACAPADSPFGILDRAKDMFPFSFSACDRVALGERRRQISLLCQFGERSLQL